LGFGAKPFVTLPDGTVVEEPKTSHLIPMIPYKPGYHGAIEIYKHQMINLTPSGPAHYGEIIQFINRK
jgi:hypothetical protein